MIRIVMIRIISLTLCVLFNSFAFSQTQFVQYGKCLNSIVNKTNVAIKNHATELRLPYSGINDGCLDSLVEALRQNKSIVRLYLAKNGLTDQSAIMLSVLFNMNKSIQGIDLSSNYLTSFGIEKIIHAMISNDTLEFITLRNMNLDLRSVTAIAEFLKKSHSLRNIDLSMNSIGRTGIERIATHVADEGKQIDSLALFDAKLSGQGAVIADLIRHFPNLEWLNLGGNQLNHQDLKEILVALAESKKIEGLDLSFNQFDDVDIELLAEYLPQYPRLVRLSLGHNQISDHGFKMLAESVIKLPDINQLDINSNNITDKSLVTIDYLLKNTRALTNLITVNNALTKEVIREFSINQKYLDKFVVVAKKHQDNVIYDKNHKPII